MAGGSLPVDRGEVGRDWRVVKSGSAALTGRWAVHGVRMRRQQVSLSILVCVTGAMGCPSWKHTVIMIVGKS